MAETSSATPKDKTPAPKPETKRKTEPVDYEVYRVGQGMLQFVGPARAVNDVKAIQVALGEQPQAGKYVAVPVRSLRVREVGTETQVKVVIK